jgi:hypothetical protein
VLGVQVGVIAGIIVGIYLALQPQGTSLHASPGPATGSVGAPWVGPPVRLPARPPRIVPIRPREPDRHSARPYPFYDSQAGKYFPSLDDVLDNVFFRCILGFFLGGALGLVAGASVGLLLGGTVGAIVFLAVEHPTVRGSAEAVFIEAVLGGALWAIFGASAGAIIGGFGSAFWVAAVAALPGCIVGAKIGRNGRV